MIAGHLDTPEFANIFQKAEDAGMHTNDINNIYAALHAVSDAIALAYVKDITGDKLEIEGESDINVVSSVTLGVKGSGKTFSYAVNESVDGLANAPKVDVSLGVIFTFPVRDPGFSFNEGSTGATLESMEVHIIDFKAVSKGVVLTVDATNPIVTISLGATLFHDDDGSVTSATVWSIGDVVQANVHQKITENGITISIDRVGAIKELSGDLYFEEGSTEGSQVNYDSDNFSMKIELDGITNDD